MMSSKASIKGQTSVSEHYSSLAMTSRWPVGRNKETADKDGFHHETGELELTVA